MSGGAPPPTAGRPALSEAAQAGMVNEKVAIPDRPAEGAKQYARRKLAVGIVKLAESCCNQCGECVKVCPVGALTFKEAETSTKN